LPLRKVELEPQEWGQVMGIISTAPWNVANSLLMKIGEQLRRQEAQLQLGGLPPGFNLGMSEQALESRMKDGAS
jgi:hypothetical protein